MKIKKVLAILLSLTLSAGVLTACGDSGDNVADTSSVKASESIETSTEAVEASGETAVSEEAEKVEAEVAEEAAE